MADYEEEATPLPPYTYKDPRDPEKVKGGPREGGSTVEIGAPPNTETISLLGQRSAADGLEGIATFPNGDTYVGGYHGGSRHFKGTYTYSGGQPAEEGDEVPPPLGTYEGTWKMGAKSGVGVMKYKDGSSYHGNYKDGLRDGQGSFYYVSGDIYSGCWAAGKKHGTGTYFFSKSGAKAAGTWVEGVLTEGTFTDKHGGVYKGAFAGDAAAVGYGVGLFTSPAGAVSNSPVCA